MPKTKSRPARPAPTERTSRRPRLHAAARDEPQSVVQAATPQALSSPVEQSAPQAPTTSVCTIPVTEPPVPTGNLTLVPLDSNHTILPLPVGSTQFSLGYYVDPSTRDKIISGKYINLGTLLVRDPNQSHVSSTLAIDATGQLIAQPKSHHKIQNIDRWTDAFIIFMSIYTAAHPEKIQQFLKYMHDIRLGSQRSQGWLTYDEQYRLRASINQNTDWGVVDPELWMIYMTPTAPQTHTYNQTHTSNKRVNSDKCFDYNFKGACTRPNCQYVHRCLRCNNAHSSNTCSLATPTQATKVNRPFRFNTPNQGHPPLPIQQQPLSQIPSTPQTIIPFGLWEAPQSLLSPFHSIYNITQIGMPQKL